MKALLGKESPEALAERAVAGSKLADPAVRKALWDGGLAAVQASDDPMIQLVLRNEPAARAVRQAWERRKLLDEPRRSSLLSGVPGSLPAGRSLT